MALGFTAPLSGSSLTGALPAPLPTAGLSPPGACRPEPVFPALRLRPCPLADTHRVQRRQEEAVLSRLWMWSPGREAFYPELGW